MHSGEACALVGVYSMGWGVPNGWVVLNGLGCTLWVGLYSIVEFYSMVGVYLMGWDALNG